MTYGSAGGGGASTSYVTVAAGGSGSAPKPIGLVPRCDGLASGLTEVRARIETLASKIAPLPPNPKGQSVERPKYDNLPSALDHAEYELRECLAMLGQINDAL